MKMLSVDLGKVRTGIAVCDAQEILASPLTVLRQPNREKLLEEIAALVDAEKPGKIVLGHPLNMDGSAGESAQAAEAFGEQLTARTGVPVVLQDERGTTVSAHHYLNETDTRGKKRKAVVDAVAAVIILQNHLEYCRMHRENG